MRTGRHAGGARNMDPVAYSVSDVLKMVGISRTKFYGLVGTGAIKVRKIGNRSIILARDLNIWLESLPTLAGKEGDDV